MNVNEDLLRSFREALYAMHPSLDTNRSLLSLVWDLSDRGFNVSDTHCAPENSLNGRDG